MSSPKKGQWQQIRRIGRYLLGVPRLVMCFPWQAQASNVITFTDSDWAGCTRTARSTSGGILTIGRHVIKTYSRQQKVVALSSAEAELYAMVAASAETLAIIAYAKDLGVAMSGEVFTDSSAALGISQRLGLGKVRHLRTQGLWVQEVRATGRLTYLKVLGSQNPADILTKHVSADLLACHLETLKTEVRGGRAETAPGLSSLVSVTLKYLEWSDRLKQECPAPQAPETSKALSERTRVRFSQTVCFRAIPSANRARPCTKKSCKAMQGCRQTEVIPEQGEPLVRRQWRRWQWPGRNGRTCLMRCAESEFQNGNSACL